ncbi:MAG: hypothetical protein IJB65_00750 [Clostridia bacterium]|nr:hypothetical protein [Clostridia bacterium]
MKNATITVSYDEEKLNALRLYLKQRDSQPESELERALEALYNKTVPIGVREFIDMRSGVSQTVSKPKKPKPFPPSAVGVAVE